MVYVELGKETGFSDEVSCLSNFSFLDNSTVSEIFGCVMKLSSTDWCITIEDVSSVIWLLLNSSSKTGGFRIITGVMSYVAESRLGLGPLSIRT